MMETSCLFGLLQENFFHPQMRKIPTSVSVILSQVLRRKWGDVSDAGKPVQ